MTVTMKITFRGTIYLFNIVKQFYCILPVRVEKCSCIRFHPLPRRTDLILATKDGSLMLLEYNGKSNYRIMNAFGPRSLN